MWVLDVANLETLTPTEQLWVIAQALQENGGPPSYVLALRCLADRLENVAWWLSEPMAGSSSCQL